MCKIFKTSFFVLFFSINLYSQNQPFTSINISPFNTENFISNVIDFDNDGDDDVFGWQNHVLKSTILYKNEGKNIFKNVSNVTNFPARNNGIAADLDKNGFMDIYFISGDTLLFSLYDGKSYSSINLSNSCGFQLLSNLFNTTASSIKYSKIGDFDNDGIYDIAVHIVNGSSSNIYAKKGVISSSGCSYTISSQNLNLISLPSTNTASFQYADIDNDFDFDLLIAQGSSQYSNYSYSIYLNNGKGSFSLLNNSGYTLGRINGFGMLGELNNDGKLDIISGAADNGVTGNPLNVYYSSLSNLNFTNNTTAMKRVGNPYYQGATIVDLNLDNKLDIIWTNMTAIGSSALQCFINNGNNTFTESASTLGINFGPSTGNCCPILNGQQSTVLDLNNDNKPDIDIHEIDWVAPYTVTKSYQKLNITTNNSVKLKLDACTGLREGWGARIQYLCNGVWSYQQHTGYSSANNPFLYLGMGSATKIDSLIIKWVGGKITNIHNVPAGSYISISETDKCAYSPGVNTIAAIPPQGNTSISASMTLYPNPTTNILHIQVGDAKALEGYRYRILDALGKVVYNELVKSAITEIPLMSLGAVGMYQFEVLDQKNTTIQTNKIVLQ